MRNIDICKGERCKFISSILILCLLMAVIDSILCAIFLLSSEDANVSNLWRTREGILTYAPFGIFVYMVMSATIVVLFRDFVIQKNKRPRLMLFLKAGLLIGLLIGSILLGFYIILPVGLDLVFVWFSSSLIFGILAGYILYFLNR